MATLNEIKFLSRANANNVSSTDQNKLYLVETPVIVETYVNGTEWYRVWSDGWIEQGGKGSRGSNHNFSKAFSDLTSLTFVNSTCINTSGSGHSSDCYDYVCYTTTYWIFPKGHDGETQIFIACGR